MTVLEIVRAYLEANGYDGLYSSAECACEKEDLGPCGSIQDHCQPGYLQPCDCGEHDWHIGKEKL